MQKQHTRYVWTLALGLSMASGVTTPATAQQGTTEQSETSTTEQQKTKVLRSPDVVYVPTPEEVVDAMLKLADVHQGDVLYDLGSGDGRIPITAVKKFNATRSIGIDINPQRIKEAEENRKANGVEDRVRFLNEDLFEADIHDATVVTLYLLPSLNLRLLPKLLKDLQPGTRVVSHSFDMGEWKPEKTVEINKSYIYFWRIPAPGTPEYNAAMAAAETILVRQ